jgi:Ribonuclease G/E
MANEPAPGGMSNQAEHDMDHEDLESVADRLDAALDVIVRRLGTGGPQPEVAWRLDRVIARLRAALEGLSD